MKKPSGLLVAIGMGKPKPKDDDDDADYEADEGKTAAAEEILAAVKSGDAEELSKAICSLVDMHMEK